MQKLFVSGTTYFLEARAGTLVLIVQRCIAAKIGRSERSTNKSINQSIDLISTISGSCHMRGESDWNTYYKGITHPLLSDHARLLHLPQNELFDLHYEFSYAVGILGFRPAYILERTYEYSLREISPWFLPSSRRI